MWYKIRDLTPLVTLIKGDPAEWTDENLDWSELREGSVDTERHRDCKEKEKCNAANIY